MVRDNLDALLALKASGSTWKEIAAGLTAQGYAAPWRRRRGRA
jgi:hypothetical protein